jgi:4-diphosphocytidyl-2-C-methyl-D-erythritol kinase
MPAAGKALHLRAHAKVNLALEVLGTRDDGYHELRTLFQTISLHDDIVLRPRATKDITILCDHPAVPTDETNLAVRAARDLQRFAGVSRGVEITLTKGSRSRRPGAAAGRGRRPLGLDRLWRVGLGPAGLPSPARRLGADVPLFP